MTLSWNEIKDRAFRFSKEWTDTKKEIADAKPFLIEFFDVFGINRKRVATFEHKVKKLDDSDGFIDLLWKGTILIEMKSRGKNLDKAFIQAKEYLFGLKDYELPRFVMVSDFDIIRLHDLEDNSIVEFRLKDLANNVHHFGYLIGYQKKTYKEQDPANIKAAELMGKLHDRLKEIGYIGHPLEVYLVRILFCLFSEDTTIFQKRQFQEFIEDRTSEDGSDLAARLQELFQVLNTPLDKRFSNLEEHLVDFPYVNGKLFEEILPTASFDTNMRKSLLDCCQIDWSRISPAIFGSMFQSVMNPVERRNLGAHYTSEKNILKLIKPLFLDGLYDEFYRIQDNINKLKVFQGKLSTLKFLDPACGCGNFLVITYRELRLLEMEVLRKIYAKQQATSIESLVLLNIDQFYGIEFEEFPARIAEVAMWLIDHQLNMKISEEYGQYFARLPLKKTANIVHGDALMINWEDLVSKKELSYILGNPPFIGSKIMKQSQRDQIVSKFENSSGSGVLDYVSGWYITAAKYIQNTKIKVAFVSTNSIVQGEQTSILWEPLLFKYNIKIHFAHRTFKWSNEARGNAAVFCVIIGFANYDITDKRIFEYEDIKGEPHELKAKNINPYLVDSNDIIINKRTSPICNVPKIKFGNQPIDGGHLLMTEIEKNKALESEPNIVAYIRQYVGSIEFINNIPRFCLWLNNVDATVLRNSTFIAERLKNVRLFRLSSTRKDTRDLAESPYKFAFVSHEENDYIIIPSVSSEKRKYIPMGFMPAQVIASNLCLIVPKAKLFHFGVLTSEMHMTWIKHLCGRLKSDYRYSNSVVYNTFPWPDNPNAKQLNAIEEKAQQVIAVRKLFPNQSLADLYDPLTMPIELLKAHKELDKAVDLAYRPQPFTSEANRMEFLFGLYEKYTADLFTKEKQNKRKESK